MQELGAREVLDRTGREWIDEVRGLTSGDGVAAVVNAARGEAATAMAVLDALMRVTAAAPGGSCRHPSGLNAAVAASCGVRGTFLPGLSSPFGSSTRLIASWAAIAAGAH